MGERFVHTEEAPGSKPGTPTLRLTPRAVALLTTAAIVVLTWPVPSVRPLPGLDASWSLALHLAARDHLRFGPEIAFTYGPLGFLGVPTLLTGPLLALDLAFTAAVHGLVTWLGYARVRRWAPWPVAAGAAFLVARVRAHSDEALAVALLAVLVLGATGQVSDRTRRLLPLVAGAVSGVALLVKVNSGVTCLMATAAYVLLTGRRDRRPALLAAGATAAAFLGGWLATGQRLGDVGAYVGRSLAVATGYSEAMATFGGWWHPFLAASVVVLALTVAVAVAVERGRRLAVAVVVAPVAWAFFKHGVVRFHFGGLLLLSVLLVLVLPLRAGRARWVAPAALLVAVAAVQSMWRQPPSYWTDVRRQRAALGHELSLVLDARERAREIAEAKATIAAAYRLPDDVPALVAGHTVHVDPYETSAVLALDATWRPVPVFQTYSAYTPALDDANAAALAGPGAPEYVLRERRLGTIDRRYALFESPAYLVALACHYRVVETTTRWQVLERAGDRCGEPRPIGTVRARPGETVAVPAPADPGSIVYARIAVRPPLVDRLATALARPLREPWIDLGPVHARFVTPNAGQPLMLRPPPADGYLRPGATPAESLRLSTWLGSYTVRFYEVPVGYWSTG